MQIAIQLEKGIRLLKLGQFEEAILAFEKILRKHPENAEVLHFCGVAKHQLGRHKEAVKLIERAVARLPRAIFYLNLALCYAALNKHADAIKQLVSALRLQPELIDAWYNLGVLYGQINNYEAAISSYQKLLSLSPNHLAALNNLGDLLSRVDRKGEAERVLRQALTLRPDFTDAQYNLARLILDEHPEDAAKLLKEVVHTRPQFIDASRLYARALARSGVHEAAHDVLELALAGAPHEANLHNDLGLICLELGKLDAAQYAFEQAIELEPRHTHALYNLTFSVKAAANPALFDKVKAAIDHSGQLPSEESAMLHFAAGHLLEAARDYDAAFMEFLRANKLKNVHYEPEKTQAHFDAIKSFFTPNVFAEFSSKIDSEQAVFIVGMPRSGTTLTEQIIASHPLATGAGELLLFNQIANGLGAILKSELAYPECIRDLTMPIARELAQRYLGELQRRGGDQSQKITDKMPGNFVNLGLIALLLPKAKIIHCQRDPINTCVSCFTANFTGFLPYAYDLGHLGHYYRCYEDLMAHWKKVLPLSIYTLNYEDLVSNSEKEIRSLIDFVGLPWSDSCLTPHQTRRAVSTASNVQVREPIYKRSIDRASNFTSHLEPLRLALLDPPNC